ncbi:MAG TPA: hypothetical protein VK495_17195 [Steroidobacteraceae bacterium]|jgi:hypothetical protein|nr:hypothetical protein [Steroidobacteraceae bacterium]
MSNENQSGNMNEQGGSGKTDPNRATDAPKTGQQSQNMPRQTDKGASQQGGSDQKSGQQSQGSPKENDGTKQAGSPKVI